MNWWLLEFYSSNPASTMSNMEVLNNTIATLHTRKTKCTWEVHVTQECNPHAIHTTMLITDLWLWFQQSNWKDCRTALLVRCLPDMDGTLETGGTGVGSQHSGGGGKEEQKFKAILASQWVWGDSYLYETLSWKNIFLSFSWSSHYLVITTPTMPTVSEKNGTKQKKREVPMAAVRVCCHLQSLRNLL